MTVSELVKILEGLPDTAIVLFYEPESDYEDGYLMVAKELQESDIRLVEDNEVYIGW